MFGLYCLFFSRAHGTAKRAALQRNALRYGFNSCLRKRTEG